MSDRDEGERNLRRRFESLSTLQQRFEGSRVGEIVISVLVAVLVLAGVLRNLPESPIKRSLLPVVGPVAAATYVNQEWALFAPAVPTRTETIEVQVFMADGSVRTWMAQPGDRLTGIFTWSRWKRLTNFAVTDKPGVRAGISRWVARRVTEPTERPIRVEMVLTVKNLTPPGQTGTGATATKVLYEEELAGRP